jgi:hypothetical protein
MTVYEGPGSGSADLPDGPPAGGTRETSALDELLGRSTPPPATSHSRRVLIRIQGGDEIVVGRAGDRDEAVRIARDLVREVEEAAARHEWPEIDGRFLRPGAIVSIDVQRAE